MLARSQILPWVANGFASPAAEGAAIAMLAVILFLAFSIFGAAMVLRNRARSAPRPENELLEELEAEALRHKHDKPTEQTKPASARHQDTDKPEWEREPDWWKQQDK